MPKNKGGKSSATSGTRKKHAKRAEGRGEHDNEDQQSTLGGGPPNAKGGNKSGKTIRGPDGQKIKLSKAQRKALPKIKQYIPPPKPPAPPIPDPLDGLGLARTLPAELVVVLRRLGKKDDVTRRKGIEDFRDEWVIKVVSKTRTEGGETAEISEDEEIQREMDESIILSAIPVLLHNLASLLQSPFHRTAALQVQNDLLSVPSLRSKIIDTLSLSLMPGSQNRDVLGSWMVSVLEEGRRAGGQSLRSWESVTNFSNPSLFEDDNALPPMTDKIDLTAHIDSLVEYLTLSILDPPSLHRDIHPPPVASTPAQSTSSTPKTGGGKGGKPRPNPPATSVIVVPEEDYKLAEERWARYRVAGLVGLSYLVQKTAAAGCTSPPTSISALLRNPLMWTAISSASTRITETPIGTQPPIRRAAYALLSVLVDIYPGEVGDDELLGTLASVILGSCWTEKEAVVWETAGPAIVKFLTKFRQSWDIVIANHSRHRKTTDGVDVRRPSGSSDDQDDDTEEGDEDDVDEDGVDENDEKEGETQSFQDESRLQQLTSSFIPPEYANFLDFLSIICPSIPHLTYPLILLIVSTLPPALLMLNDKPSPSLPLQTFFSHLWSPFDAHLLSTHTLPNSQSAFQVFLQTALDCTVFLVNRSYKPPAEVSTAVWLVNNQLGERSWGEGVLGMGGRAGGRHGKKGVDPIAQEAEAVMFGNALAKVASVSDDLLKNLMSVIERVTLDACFPHAQSGEISTVDATEGKVTIGRAVTAASVLSRSLTILSLLKTATRNSIVSDSVDSIIRQIFSITTTTTSTPSSSLSLTVERAEILVEILNTYGSLLDSHLVSSLSHTIQTDLPELVVLLPMPTVVALFHSLVPWLNKDGGDELRNSIWRFLEDGGKRESGKRFGFVQAVMDDQAVAVVADGALDTVVIEAAQVALSGDNAAAKVVSTAVTSPQWLSSDAVHTILALICTSIHDTVDALFCAQSSNTMESERGPISPSPAALDILAAFAPQRLDEIVKSDIYVQALVSVHHLVALAPRLGMSDRVPVTAHQIWNQVKEMNEELKRSLAGHVSASLRHLLSRVTCIAGPSTIIDVALASELGTSKPTAGQVASTLLPSTTTIIELIESHTSRPADPILSIVDPLIPASSSYDQDGPSRLANDNIDSQGRSVAARLSEAVLALLRFDRQLVQSVPALLQIVVLAMILATDSAAVPTSSRGFFGFKPSLELLSETIRDAEAAISFSLTAIDEAPVSWHKASVESLKVRAKLDKGLVDDEGEDKLDWLQKLLLALASGAKESDVEARGFKEILSRHLRQSGAGEAEAEVWLQYAMSASERDPNVSIAIIYAIKHIMLDTKSFTQAQNRLANALTGIQARHANTKGIPALRLLIASAPPEDAASVFIPQQRAIFVMRHVTGWLTSTTAEDDDTEELDDSIETYLAALYVELAPIIQDVSGSHWEGIFDLIEGGLETGSMSEAETYPLLYRTLVLLVKVEELCSANKSLREEYWSGESKKIIFGLVLKLFLSCRDAESVPLQMLHEVVLSLIQHCPESVMSTANLVELCDLIRLSSSFAIQRTAYRILSQVIKQSTLALVLEVEASVASETEGEGVSGSGSEKIIAIPHELVDIVDAGRGVDWYSESRVELVLAQLLAWMAIMDHFDDASRTLRWAYLDQLNSSRLLEESLLPLLFAMLGVSEVGAWNFPASQYAVDEFYTDLLQPDHLADLTPLASHVFYRVLVTIPSSIRSYYESLKDRQLSLSLLAFTARNFSPVIIAHEFSALREPSAMAQLTDEGLSVRIAQGGGATVAVAGGGGAAEAIASYTVDEQPMEIGIRLPAEFPLKGVDVRDLRRVGVPENKWRGWLMGVQQTITSRNGLVLEALTVFKKNVALHFEGVVECAICYSIISLTDRTLPTKPCRTCKNRFHASCLFKWFNSSHSSSCPLCRSLF